METETQVDEDEDQMMYLRGYEAGRTSASWIGPLATFLLGIALGALAVLWVTR